MTILQELLKCLERLAQQVSEAEEEIDRLLYTVEGLVHPRKEEERIGEGQSPMIAAAENRTTGEIKIVFPGVKAGGCGKPKVSVTIAGYTFKTSLLQGHLISILSSDEGLPDSRKGGLVPMKTTDYLLSRLESDSGEKVSRHHLQVLINRIKDHLKKFQIAYLLESNGGEYRLRVSVHR